MLEQSRQRREVLPTSLTEAMVDLLQHQSRWTCVATCGTSLLLVSWRREMPIQTSQRRMAFVAKVALKAAAVVAQTAGDEAPVLLGVLGKLLICEDATAVPLVDKLVDRLAIDAPCTWTRASPQDMSEPAGSGVGLHAVRTTDAVNTVCGAIEVLQRSQLGQYATVLTCSRLLPFMSPRPQG